MKTLLFSLLFLAWNGFALSQGVGLGTTDPHASAALDVSSTTQGVLVPRMTTGQRIAIPTPATGLLVFDMTTQSFWFKGNTNWVELRDSSNSVVHTNGTNLFMGLGGYVGIGTTTPTSKLDVTTPSASEGISHSDGNVRMATSTTADRGQISTTSNHPLFLSANNAIAGVLITPIGAVGIGGVVAPIAALEVKADAGAPGIRATDGNVTIGTTTTSDAGIIETVSDHPLILNASGGPNHLVITPLGAVGIGTVTPTAQLEVKSALQSPGLRHTDGNVTLGSATLPNAGVLETVSNHPFHLRANGGANQMVITPEGRVGIGTDMPDAKLDIRTSTDIPGLQHSDGAIKLATKVGSGAAKLMTTSNHPLQLSSNSLANQLTLATNGKVGIGTMTPHGALQFSNDLANRKVVMFEAADNDHQFYGMGINPSTLRYQVDGPNANHVFYSATSPSASTELMRIEGDGNVGINVSNPANRLDVHYSATNRYGTHAASRPMYVTGDMLEDNNGIEFRHTNGTQGIGFGYNTIYASGSNDNQDLALKSRGTGDLVFKTNANERMRVTDNGNVGIGHNNPNAQLQLGNSLANKKIILWEDAANDHQFFGMGINPSTLRYQVSNATTDHVFYSGASTTSSNELMRIKGNGNIGIGNSNPEAKLDVGGDAHVAGNMAVNGDSFIEGLLDIGYDIQQAQSSIPGLALDQAITCSCPVNTRVLGGGFYGNGLDVYGSEPHSGGDGWTVYLNNFTIDAHTIYVYAICARL